MIWDASLIWCVFAMCMPFSPPLCVCAIQKLLSPTGSLYMVLVQENKPKQIISMLLKYGLQSEVSSECDLSVFVSWLVQSVLKKSNATYTHFYHFTLIFTIVFLVCGLPSHLPPFYI